MEYVKTILIGIITWLICCFLQFLWNKSKTNFNENNNEKSKAINNRPAYNQKFLVKEYYISLVIIVICFIISFKITITRGFLSAMFIAAFTTAVFFNWCAFSCMNDMAKKSESDFTSEKTKNENK